MNYKVAILPLAAIVLFLIITFTYFSPLIEGKTLSQADVKNWHGMAQEILDHREANDGENALWTNSMFGGMPSYLISVVFPGKTTAFIHNILNLGNLHPAGHLFLYLLGFYFILLAFGADQKVCIIGAFTYAFSTYFLIIIEAGHVTKAIAIGYMPLVIAGCYLAFTKRPILGSLILALALSFQLGTRHYQITYYTLIVVVLLGLFQVYLTVKNKSYLRFIKTMSMLILAAVIALAIDFPNFYLINEYSKYSMRGKSELTNEIDNKTTGLDKDYITSWSYGIAETWTFLIPNFQGGGFADDFKYSDFYKEMHPRYKQYFIEQGYPAKMADKVANQQIGGSFYWGDQPFTSGPVYLGAVVIFLFVLGLFVLKGWLKWWLLTVTVVSIFLGWGKHFMWFTDLWLDFVPGYSKFRTVSMTLVIAELSIPLLAILGLDQIIKSDLTKTYECKGACKKLQISKNFLQDSILKSLIITGGITLFIALFASSLFNFGQEKFQEMNEMTQRIIEARESVLKADAWRSFLFIAAAAVLLLIYAYGKLKKNVLIVCLGLLFLFDLWPVNKRYLNSDNFEKVRKNADVYEKTPSDVFILANNKEKARVLYFPNFDVQSISTPFNDASVSYFHQSIGGYHGAKMKRYQELIEHQIHREMGLFAQNVKNGVPPSIIFPHMNVLNMLNTKYFVSDKYKEPVINSFALGNAWLVDSVTVVANADEEIEKIGVINTSRNVVVDKRFEKMIEGYKITSNKSGKIERTVYSPNSLTYKYQADAAKIAVFSEIYYDKGWNAYIDGKPSEYFRANYVLRAMKLPEGSHTVEFKFEPVGYTVGVKISFAGSLLLLLLVIGYIVDQFVRKEKSFK
ncbi:MAG: YfhO family protein [Bacteroidales bacterium]|nr:YfhO family protein [Bacteroidales bacterium]